MMRYEVQPDPEVIPEQKYFFTFNLWVARRGGDGVFGAGNRRDFFGITGIMQRMRRPIADESQHSGPRHRDTADASLLGVIAGKRQRQGL
ncbi:hypothetical protein TMES_02185 [Thalassospira mesophila]|uniref:Uncharacterized protein n=1 Tax=Thalassospira mesophila TaxID=1293891 RepID=A0A1Y2L528_9PROT|nr:hypothetical protein TMES_02185 [Thalassospira mesophila]